MIFHFHKPNRIIILSLIISFICGGVYSRFNKDFLVSAQPSAQKFNLKSDLYFSKQIEHFLNNLVKASKDECVMIFGRYAEVIGKKLSLDKLYFPSYQEVENLLAQGVNESLDALTFFTYPLLHEDPKGIAVVFKERLLQQINENFDFHGLFNISIPPMDDGSAVKMKFLIVGQGKFIVGYNRNAKIQHPDYCFATGNYDYEELFVIDANKDSDGNPGLFNIKGISNPDEEPRWMKGPLDVDIRSLTMTTDQGGRRQILIEYDLFGIQHKLINPIPIEKLCK